MEWGFLPVFSIFFVENEESAHFIMLIWRLGIGIPVILGFVFLSYLDMWVSEWFRIHGIILLPLFLICIGFLCDEVLDLLEAGGLCPRRSTVYVGTLSLAVCSWLTWVFLEFKSEVRGELVYPYSWNWASTASLLTLLALGGGIIIAFVGEMRRYSRPGGTTVNLAGAVFAITYIGLLCSFIIQLRMAFGLRAVLSLVVVTKLCDTGAYTIGRIFGVHKMVPGISPGKTVEGMIGGIAFSVIGAWLWFNHIVPFAFNTKWIPGNYDLSSFLGWFTFGIAVAISGALGDLAESLLKRDVKRKDSSRWMPGFGGFLDIFDSLLLAAPVAYTWWVFGWVG